VAAKTDFKAQSNSYAAREAKASRIGANILITPLSDFTLQAGAQVVYNATSRFQFSLTFLTGSKDITESVPKEKEEDVKLTLAKLSGSAAFTYFRWFSGNSFGLSGGLGYRKAMIDY